MHTLIETGHSQEARMKLLQTSMPERETIKETRKMGTHQVESGLKLLPCMVTWGHYK